jgi:NOL1/NOP2/fmu family ribosome biogenesis protein
MMAFIKHKESNFRKYLERHFSLVLPEGVDLFYAKGVRVGNKEIRKSRINGDLGYAACDFGFNPTNPFIQNFGHLAKRNIVRLIEDDAKAFASGKDLSMDLGRKSKHVIINYKRHVLGLGHYEADRKRIRNRIPKKRSREIINEI